MNNIWGVGVLGAHSVWPGLHIVHVFDVSSRSCCDARTFSVYDDEYPSVGAAREDGYADGVAVMMMMGCGDHAIYVRALFFMGQTQRCEE